MGFSFDTLVNVIKNPLHPPDPTDPFGKNIGMAKTPGQLGTSGGSTSQSGQRDLSSELSGILAQLPAFTASGVGLQQQYSPLLTNLNLSNYRTALLGNQFDANRFYAENPGALADYQATPEGRTPEQHAQDWLSYTGQDQSKLSGYYSGGAVDLARTAYNQANPDLVNYTAGLSGLLGRLNGNTATSYNPNGYNAATAAPVTAGPAALATYDPARAYTSRFSAANGGSLMPTLAGDATGAITRMSPIDSALQSQAINLVNSNGSLTPGELANVQDSARAAYADRGLLRSNRGVGAEILATDQARRQRLLDNANFAGGISSLVSQNQNAARNYALGVQGQQQGLNTFNAGQRNQLNQFNAGLLTDTSRYNSGLGANLSQFNAGATNAQNQYNAGLLSNINTFNAGQLNQAGQFNAGAGNTAAQFNINSGLQNANDQWNRAMGLGQLQLSQAIDPTRIAGQITGNVPDYTGGLLSYGSDLYNTNFNANSAANISANNNKAAQNGALIGGGASVAAALIAL